MRQGALLVLITVLSASAGCTASQPAMEGRAEEARRENAGATLAAFAASQSLAGIATAEAAVVPPIGFHPGEWVDLGHSGEVKTVAIADVDGDRRNDIVMATAFTGAQDLGVPSKVVVLRHAPDGALTVRDEVDYLAQATELTLATGDLEKDGRADAIVGHTRGISIVGFKPDSGYAARLVYANECLKVVTTHVDGDGDLDAVCLGPRISSDALELFSGDGRGGLGAVGSIDLDGGFDWVDLKAADVTGDGRQDLVLVEDSGTASNLRVYRALSSGGYAAPIDYALPVIGGGGTGDGSGYGMAIGDLDGDGRNDVAVSTIVAEPTLAILRQGSDSNLRAPIQRDISNEAGQMAVADFDKDGDDDLFLRHDAWWWSGVMPQQDGRLLTEIQFGHDAGSGPSLDATSIGDINSDSCPDVALVDGYRLWTFMNIDCVRRRHRTGGNQQRFRR